MDNFTIWLVIVCLGIGTFLIRFSFLGLIGGQELPDWVLRHLRYVAVAVMPALVTPLVVWPAANNGDPEPSRLLAALAVFVIGILLNNVIAAITAGLLTLYGVQYLLA